MPVTNLPGWIGSSAVAQTGQRWMSAAGSALKVPTPFWMSSLAGLPRENFILIPGTYRGGAGYSRGQTGGIALNNTGHECDILGGYESGFNPFGHKEPTIIAIGHTWFSSVTVDFIGYKRITMYNRGETNAYGRWGYAVDWEGPGLVNFLWGKVGQHVPCMIEFNP